MSTPTFAMLGAVNHGKSSVVSALAENDKVRVSRMPGETVECQRFSLGDLFVFVDTPGFQNPAEVLEVLEELCSPATEQEPLAIFREFIARHRGEPEFEAECRLFEPIVEGAGIIYVVDGSRPALGLNRTEMEILRLAGRPRIALINRTSAGDHIAEWRQRLEPHFPAVHEFNAHRATFADRIKLLEALAEIEQACKRKLTETVQVLHKEWDVRLWDCAGIILEELTVCLRHRESSLLSENALPAQRAALSEELKTCYTRAVTAIEARAHNRIITLFGHKPVKARQSAEHLFDSGLLSKETWKMLELEVRQLVAAGAVTGALVGAATDLFTAGHTLLLGTATGGALKFPRISGQARRSGSQQNCRHAQNNTQL